VTCGLLAAGSQGACPANQECTAAGTCQATCAATTDNNCVLTATYSGATETGACAAGFVGACSFSCSAGVWTQVADTCKSTVINTLNYDGYDGYLLSGTTCGTTCGNATDQQQANQTCVSAGFTTAKTYTVEAVSTTTCWCYYTNLNVWNPCCSGTGTRDVINTITCQ
jgi:hypothetical protein